MKSKEMSPESLMMSYGYNPHLSEGAVKCPVFQTSTFVFKSAEEGKAFFELAHGLREPRPHEQPGLIYSRLNNPAVQILEERLCLWDRTDACAAFESGMAAISTAFLELLKPGDVLLHSWPVYGGTDHLISVFLHNYGIHTIGFDHQDTEEDIEHKLKDSGKSDRLAMIFIETPANPTNDLIDIGMCARIAAHHSTQDKRVITAVDNTYMGPVWQHPMDHGADLVIYSATKYIGGHSDVIAGAVLGSDALILRIKRARTYLGNVASPWTAWLLMRSLETLKLRMDKQGENAKTVAQFLQMHPSVIHVHYPGFINPYSVEGEIFRRQCESGGAMISFEITGGEAEAFRFLNALHLFKLAVSLGGTESLAEHPRSMTHAGLPPEHLDAIGVCDNLIRLSIGVENVRDLMDDLTQAFDVASSQGHSVKDMFQFEGSELIAN